LFSRIHSITKNYSFYDVFVHTCTKELSLDVVKAQFKKLFGTNELFLFNYLIHSLQEKMIFMTKTFWTKV
jgi:hypothetical protein